MREIQSKNKLVNVNPVTGKRGCCSFLAMGSCANLKAVYTTEKLGTDQEPMSRSLHVHYILESTFARVFQFLEPTLQQETAGD